MLKLFCDELNENVYISWHLLDSFALEHNSLHKCLYSIVIVRSCSMHSSKHSCRIFPWLVWEIVLANVFVPEKNNIRILVSKSMQIENFRFKISYFLQFVHLKVLKLVLKATIWVCNWSSGSNHFQRFSPR